jgi:hypothetical protein
MELRLATNGTEGTNWSLGVGVLNFVNFAMIVGSDAIGHKWHRGHKLEFGCCFFESCELCADCG